MSNRWLFSNLDKIYVESLKPFALSPRVYYRVEIKGFDMSSGLVDDEVIEKLGSISKSVPKASLEYDFENKQGKREPSYDTHIVDHIAKCINEYVSKVIGYLNK